MKILYNSEGYLRDEVDWLLCSDGIISVDKLEDFAKWRGYGGGDDISMFTYDEKDNDIFFQDQRGKSL